MEKTKREERRAEKGRRRRPAIVMKDVLRQAATAWTRGIEMEHRKA